MDAAWLALDFGFTGARENVPHLQRLAIYMGEALQEIEQVLLGKGQRGPGRRAKTGATARSGGSRSR